jgi:hypothetical protein
MSRCAHCSRRIVERQDFCPHCFASVKDPSARAERATSDEPGALANQEPLATIAGFQNAAEAGYFAHELMHRTALPVELSLDNTFDGIHGYWRTRFLLGVPAAEAERAAATLQELIDESEAEDWQPAALRGELPGAEPAEDVFAFEPVNERTTAEESSIPWTPIVLTLAAGTIVMWGVRKLNDVPARQGVAPMNAAEPALWEDLSRSSKPWVQQLDNGGVRELHIDDTSREAVLREDADGNGHFERQQGFRVPRRAR